MKDTNSKFDVNEWCEHRLDELVTVTTLTRLDVGQIIDGLSLRKDSWQNTADYLNGTFAGDGCEIEECSNADEAQKIADHYAAIIAKLEGSLQ